MLFFKYLFLELFEHLFRVKPLHLWFESRLNFPSVIVSFKSFTFFSIKSENICLLWWCVVNRQSWGNKDGNSMADQIETEWVRKKMACDKVIIRHAAKKIWQLVTNWSGVSFHGRVTNCGLRWSPSRTLSFIAHQPNVLLFVEHRWMADSWCKSQHFGFTN